jgi:hypothetical protein
LVEDEAVDALEPLTLTRPAFDLLLGSTTLGQKAARAFGVDWNSTRRGVLVRSHLVRSVREDDPKAAVNDFGWLTRGPAVVVNARWVPPADFQAPIIRRPMIGVYDGQVACAWVGPGQAMGLELHKVDDWFDEMASGLDALDIGGEWIERPWDLLARNAEHLTRDFANSKKMGRGRHHLGLGTLIGPEDRLSIHPTAQVDPSTVFDTTVGTIAIEAGVIIQPYTRLEGPCSIGQNTHLFRATIRGGVTIGPDCRIGGEVEQSIIHGHSNKYDEAFLGQTYVGEWVTLGSVTSGDSGSGEISLATIPNDPDVQREHAILADAEFQRDPRPTAEARLGA